MKAENVSKISSQLLCSACGACSGVCPTGAIDIVENAAGYLYSNVQEDKCISCGKCLRICPGNNKIKSDDLVGTIRQGYVGYAKDPEIRALSQSGGIVTALLLYLLSAKKIDGAVVTCFDTQTGRAKAILATTKEEILSAKGSHYTQSFPIEILLKNQDKKIAIVALGCQSESLALIRKNYPKIKMPEYIIGLICAGNLSGRVVDHILNDAGVEDKTKLTGFRFRDKSAGGWPGNISYQYLNKANETENYTLPKEIRLELKPLYQSFRCIACNNKLNFDADIVVGDPWGMGLSDEADGYSAVLTRTETGEKLITDAVNANQIKIVQASVDKILNGQQIEKEVRNRCAAVARICKTNNWEIPYVLQNSDIDLDSKYLDSMGKKLTYLRAVQKCKTKKQALRKVKHQERKNKQVIKEWLYKILKGQ